MAGSVNKVILIGNLGRDPEIRFTQAGKKIANFSIATSETWRDRQSGERRERTEWHRIVVFSEALADVVEKYVKKGSKLFIEGQLRTRKWQGQDGREGPTPSPSVRFWSRLAIGSKHWQQHLMIRH